ncbi:hypothetical protein [Amycolatopsis sp. Poz14]|uniref:hypothetical protein n=1 Tax=Amycolatopsis sp. Poz14 TaxID=1447705 RepID=UPI001EE9A266|nr:hypothetical protein [Amycolatopsis sp. Poz14]MCG3757380.1 hypothetical protein [Amycolatopsis sp. Poz14]
MGELGIAILLAMRDQGWLIAFHEEGMTTVSPGGAARTVPTSLLGPENEWKLRYVLMAWIAVDGLAWPWPPDHDELIRGEVPPSDG